MSKYGTPQHPPIKESDLEPKFLSLWKKGIVSAEQRNWDYVISLVLPIVKEHPGFLDGRALVRRAEVERIKGQRKGLSFGGGMSLFKSSSKKEPAEQINELEDTVFQKDPYNQNANQTLFEMALRLQMPDLAAFALETIREGVPDNTKNMHRLAEHYMANDQPEKAGEVYRHIMKVEPRDMEAVKGDKDAAARSSILRQGWNDEGDMRSKMKNTEEATKLELQNRQGMTREQMEALLANTIAEYDQDQTNLSVVKRIADLYERLDDLDTALSFYNYALSLNTGDVAMQRKVEIVQDRISDQRIAQMEAEIEADPTSPDIDEKRAQIAEIKRARSSVVIAEAKARVDRNPTDKQFQYDLGSAYFHATMYTEAIPHLQQAKSNPHIRSKAIIMLGRCFEHKNMNDLAESQFSEIVKELVTMDNTKKEVLYELAMVSLKMGKREQYLDCLKEIYNNDYGYRDVAKRVEESYSS